MKWLTRRPSRDKHAGKPWRPSERSQWITLGATSGTIIGGGIAYRGIITANWYEAAGLILLGSAIVTGTAIATWKAWKSRPHEPKQNPENPPAHAPK